MKYTEICNDKWLFIWVGLLLFAVIAQCMLFMSKAWKHGMEIGLKQSQLKKGLKTGITISIMPTLPVLLVLFSLTPLLGIPLPWLRLSVIGSAYYETYAATTALSCLGETFQINGYSANGWIAALWVNDDWMEGVCILWSAFAINRFRCFMKKQKRFNIKLDSGSWKRMPGRCYGLCTVSYGFSAMSTKGVVFCISFAVGAFLMLVANKVEKAKWLTDYIMTISMLAAMAAACVIF